MLTLVILLSTTLTVNATAADIRTLDVKDQDGRYTVAFDVVLNAPRDAVYNAIADPTHWPRISKVVTSAKVVEQLPGNRRLVSVTFRDCILIFCQSVHKHETLSTSADGIIETEVFPEKSDFSSALERWNIASAGTRTRIVYHAEMTPTFYIPPVIGAYIFKNKIRALLLNVTTNLERLAAERDPS